MTQGETFGAVLAVVASIISNLGVNIQKFSHGQDSQLPDTHQRPYIQRPLWWLGLTFVILGSLGDFTAFGFATQSLVAALGGGATLVANVFTAYFLNKEALYITDLGGILFVIFGVLLIAFIAEPNAQYPLPELELRFVRREFVIYIVSVGVVIVSMLATIKGSVAHRLKNQMQSSKRKQKQVIKTLEQRIERIEHRLFTMEEQLSHQQQQQEQQQQQLRRQQQQLELDSHLTGSSFLHRDDSSSPGPAGKVSRHSENNPIGELLEGVNSPARVPYYYAICSGIIGSMTVLLAKCSAEMIRLSLQGQNQFHYPLTYVFLGGMFVFIVIQTHFLNMATSLGDIMTVFPIFQACWISFSVIGGAIFYNNEDSFSPQKWAGYPLALLSIAVGVLLLVQHQSSASSSASSRQENTGKATNGKNYVLLADEEVRLISDATMRSPLLEDQEMDEGGYLHLEA